MMPADSVFEAAVRAASEKKPPGMGDFTVRIMVGAALAAVAGKPPGSPPDVVAEIVAWLRQRGNTHAAMLADEIAVRWGDGRSPAVPKEPADG